jgi:hypothetical protein
MNGCPTYEDLVERWVALKAVDSIDWHVLVDALPGVYPTVIRDAAIKVGVWTNVRYSADKFTPSSVAWGLWKQRKLATPHALDGCWWFADETLELLADRAGRLSSDGDVIGLFGTPTLFHYMQSKADDREIVLVDRIVPDEISPARAIQADLMSFHPVLPRLASVCVVDPPWYTAETCAFLLCARLNSALGAKILLSVPPIGTRPRVMEEWDEIVRWSQRIGLRLVERLPLTLRYLSPPFEINALRAAGVPPCRNDWRKGDLAVFECMVPSPQPSASELHPATQPWRDIQIGRVRIKVRLIGSDESAKALLEEVLPDDVLPTVSRRDERLHAIQLWTSGNRVFGSGAPGVLGQILDSLVEDRSARDSRGQSARLDHGDRPLSEIELTSEKLRRIIELEELELEHWSRSLDAAVVELAS